MKTKSFLLKLFNLRISETIYFRIKEATDHFIYRMSWLISILHGRTDIAYKSFLSKQKYFVIKMTYVKLSSMSRIFRQSF